MAAYCLALFLLTAYLSQVVVPPNQLTVHRGSATLRPVLEGNRYGFALKHLDLHRTDQETAGRLALFVPGHKGNVKQAISMTRYFEKNGLLFDMYSVDFLEGAVAVSGELMQAEAEFVRDCLRYLAKERKGRITIIAHSMGGVVASIALDLEGSPVQRVQELVALSTPFAGPPVATDLSLFLQYRKLYDFWASPKSQGVFLLSFAGGVRDLTVPSYTANSNLLQAQRSQHFSTTQVEALHLELDHLALVWGLEFFAQLTKALQVLIAGGDGLEQRLQEVLGNALGTMLYSPPANVEAKDVLKVEEAQLWTGKREVTAGQVYRVVDDEVIILATTKPQIYRPEAASIHLHPSSVDIEGTKVSLLRVKNDSVDIIPASGTQFQRLNSPNTEMSLAGALFSRYSFEVPLDSPYVFRLRPGSDFSSFRYPLHVSVQCESSQIKAAHVRCGSEEIVKFNENDFIIYLNEMCAEGPEIYLLGFDPLHRYQVTVNVDWMGMLVVFARDFRMHVVTSGMVFYLLTVSGLSTMWQRIIAAGILVVLRLCGPQLRLIAAVYPYEDHVPQFDAGLGLPEYIYIGLVGHSLSYAVLTIIAYVYILARFVTKYVPRAVYFVWILLAPVVLVYPWPYILISSFISVLYDSSVGSQPKPGLFLAYLLTFTTLPQAVGWLIVLLDHNVPVPLTPSTALTAIPSLLSLLVLNLRPGENYPICTAVAAVVVGLSAFEFTYRANLEVAAVLVVVTLAALRRRKEKTE